jgi:hypothetical protein
MQFRLTESYASIFKSFGTIFNIHFDLTPYNGSVTQLLCDLL